MTEPVARGKITFNLPDGTSSFRWIKLWLEEPAYRGVFWKQRGAEITEKCYQLFDAEEDPWMYEVQAGQETPIEIDVIRGRCSR